MIGLVAFATVASSAIGCNPEVLPPSAAGMTSNGGMWMHTDVPNLPDDCKPTFFGGDTEIFAVADRCCTTEVGSFEWIPFETFATGGSHADSGAVWTGSEGGYPGCMKLDPFGSGGNFAVIVNGCQADGTQFYGEKCGGSSFTAAPDEVTYGACGQATETCGCLLYAQTSSPGCYAIASPLPEQNGVFAKFEGCSSTGGTDTGSTAAENADEASHFALPSLLISMAAFAFFI